MQQETKRQKMVAGLLNKELSDIFQRQGLNIVNGGMISISKVSITPDLFEARVYLSFFKVEDPAAMLQIVNDKAWEIKKELTARVKNQFRRMPVLKFYADDTLDHVFKMEELLNKVKAENNQSQPPE